MCFVVWFLNRALYGEAPNGLVITGIAFIFLALLQLMVLLFRLLRRMRTKK